MKMTKLREAAQALRDKNLDSIEARTKAAAALDDLAASVEVATRGLSRWLARGTIASALVFLGMVTAGIWVDWRWAVTSVVPFALTGTLGGILASANKGLDG